MYNTMTHFNFQTMKEVNPLKSLEFFYINPYMPDNFIRLGLNKREIIPEGTAVTEKGHFVIYFSISNLIKGDVHIKWTDEDKFVINRKIYCKVIKKNVIRIDSILY